MDPIYLQPDAAVDSDHPTVRRFAAAHADPDPIRAACSLYLAVRDGFRYSPWNVSLDPADYRASLTIARGPDRGAHCIDKALVLAAGARALGIPSRLHFADVRNHIGTERLERLLGTDRLVFHGYVELWLGGRWVAATPAFDRALCERLGVEPLEFDGIHDSVFQAYDRKAGRFMEYLADHGAHPTIPFDTMFEAWKRHYGHILTRWPSSTHNG